jgi:hypothetical protein
LVFTIISVAPMLPVTRSIVPFIDQLLSECPENSTLMAFVSVMRAGLAPDEARAFEGQHHLVDGRRGDPEVAVASPIQQVAGDARACRRR